MGTYTYTIRANTTTATQVVAAGDGPHLIWNRDLTNVVFVGDTNSVRVGDAELVQLDPNGSIAVDGKTDKFVISSVNGVQVSTILGGMSNFRGLSIANGSLVLPSLHSPGFAQGVAGWTINNDDSAEFNNLTLRGTFFGNNHIINSDGEFVYAGIPAIGNLIQSITNLLFAGTDPEGNAIVGGDTLYTTAGGVSYAIRRAGVAVSQVFTAATQAGPYSPVTGWEILLSNAGLGHEILLSVPGGAQVDISDSAGIQLNGQVTAVGGTSTKPTLITTDGWHSLGTLAGYTINSARYRLTTWGSYELDINVTSLGANTANTIFSVALPAGYSGGSSTGYPLTANYVLTAGDAHPRLIVASGGGVTVAQTANKSGLITGQAFVPAT